ncbi:MAG: betaine/proline/choline family ABC transporter ATP-binding protein [Limnochordia bacterium]
MLFVSAAIEVSNLWKIYDHQEVDVEDEEALEEIEEQSDGVIAVRDVSFSIDPGEFFIVMGLSGSGKSTLIRCLLRLLEPTSGQIAINGQIVTELDQQDLIAFRRKQVAMVFQQYGLLPHCNVIDNVAFGLKLQGVDKNERYDRARKVLDTVGLGGWEEYFPHALSGGMRQRVGIARALVIDPPVLLMDEPFSGLDPLIRREMQEELLRLQEQLNKTIFFVTHDLDEALRLGDRMAVMKSGSFVQVGTPQEILADPADDYVARFVDDKGRQPRGLAPVKEMSKDVS